MIIPSQVWRTGQSIDSVVWQLLTPGDEIIWDFENGEPERCGVLIRNDDGGAGALVSIPRARDIPTDEITGAASVIDLVVPLPAEVNAVVMAKPFLGCHKAISGEFRLFGTGVLSAANMIFPCPAVYWGTPMFQPFEKAV